jgi:hypothetical protein
VSFQVSPTFAVEGWKATRLPLPSGFLFARDGHWLAAAEWWQPGKLRLAPALASEDRRLIATASAALMLANSLQMPGL